MLFRSDKEFVCLENAISNFNLQRRTNLVSLKESERRQERDVEEKRRLACDSDKVNEKIGNKVDDGQGSSTTGQRAKRDDGLQPDERNLMTELALEKSRKNAKDILLNETGHILSDEIDLLQRNARFLAGNIAPSIR